MRLDYLLPRRAKRNGIRRTRNEMKILHFRSALVFSAQTNYHIFDTRILSKIQATAQKGITIQDWL